MKNVPIVFMVVIIILVLGMVGIYAYANKNYDQPFQQTMTDGERTQESMTEKNEKTTNESEDSKMMSSGKYLEYTPEILAESADTRRVLFFYANWCPICQPADANFTKNIDKIPQDVTLVRVNYNDTETDQSEKELAKKYGIAYQHTFVQIDKNGQEITKWNGGQIEELLTNLK